MIATSAERPDLLPPARKLEVEEQLLRIAKSSAFSASPRCQQLLTYLVRQSIAGSYDLLRERVIGAEVFGRDAAYDTGGDSIVRVRANDVRKRLAQYYDGAPGRDREIRFHLPIGSYVPEFAFPVHRPAVPVDRELSEPKNAKLGPVRSTGRSARMGVMLALAIVAVGAVSIGIYRWKQTLTARSILVSGSYESTAGTLLPGKRTGFHVVAEVSRGIFPKAPAARRPGTPGRATPTGR